MFNWPASPRLNDSGIPRDAILGCGPVEAISGVVTDSPFAWPLRAQMSAAPFSIGTSVERKTGNAVRTYPMAASTTRSSPAFMPWGKFTSQVRRASSTCNSMVARAGGWVLGDSMKRKSGPICAMRKLTPFKSSRIRTIAECPP